MAHRTLAAISSTDFRDKDGNTACMTAVLYEDETFLASLLEAGVAAGSVENQVLATDNLGKTALMLAASNGLVAHMAMLLAHESEKQVYASDRERSTALMAAAMQGDEACIELLLQHDPEAQVLAADEDGWTALMHVAAGGVYEEEQVVCMQLLLRYVPERQVIAAATRGGRATALMLAVNNNFGECVTEMLKYVPEQQVVLACKERRLPLMYAAEWRWAEGVTQLLDYVPEIQVNAVDEDGWTALMRVAYKTTAATVTQDSATRSCIEILLAHGSPLPENVELQRAIQPVVQGLAQTVRTPTLLNRSIAQAVAALPPSARNSKRRH